MAKKHYRVAKKQINACSSKGVFIPHARKLNLLTISCVIVFLIFLKGLFLGYILGKKS